MSQWQRQGYINPQLQTSVARLHQQGCFPRSLCTRMSFLCSSKKKTGPWLFMSLVYSRPFHLYCGAAFYGIFAQCLCSHQIFPTIKKTQPNKTHKTALGPCSGLLLRQLSISGCNVIFRDLPQFPLQDSHCLQQQMGQACRKLELAADASLHRAQFCLVPTAVSVRKAETGWKSIASIICPSRNLSQPMNLQGTQRG